MVGRLMLVIATGLAMVSAAGALAQEAPQPVPAPETRIEQPDIRIDAPRTRIEIDSSTGKTKVEAPRTFVAVDPQAGRVQVRAPFVNLDLRW